jgi:tRNA threonylcarbamoyl adenosine modification protein (Sua5/YciO/YrdC/YwlC family)
VHRVAQRWWPGPLTLVLPRRSGLALHLGEPETTVGLRVPEHPLVQAVAAAVGPIATTSANRHGEPTATTAQEAVAALGEGVALAVDGGRLEGRSSTVVDATGPSWRVLREGPVPADELLRMAPG